MKKFGGMYRIHWVIIFFSLLLTFFAWYFAQNQVSQKRSGLFYRESKQVIELTQERLQAYEDALWAGVAVIKSHGGNISYNQWKIYVRNLNLLKKYPGINGIGVIYRVTPNKLEAYLDEQKIDRPGFNIHPAHKNNIYFPITYIVPVKGNEKAVGLDMAHESNRYNAIMRAVKTGGAQITRPIVLVQDNEKTPGFLFYVPYYKGRHNTLSLKEENFVGAVYAPFIMKKLVKGVLSQDNRHVRFRITDQGQVLYNELGSNFQKNSAKYNYSKVISIYGQKWKFFVSGDSKFDKAVSDYQPKTILVCGLIIDGLLLFLFIHMARSNKYAIEYANEQTKEINEKAYRLELLNDNLNKANSKLEKIANFDLLTGLPSKNNFILYLEKSVARCKNDGSMLAVCIIGIDNFKLVNDTIGHEAGDDLLKLVARLFEDNLRDIDYLARLSGDEFVFLLDHVKSSSQVALIIRKYLSVFSDYVRLNQNDLKITFSAGVSVYPSGGGSASQLIKNSDIAIYKAKKLGANRIEFYNKATNEAIKRRHEIEVALKDSIKNSEFSLLYQPQLETSTGNLFGVEALLRWHSDRLGQVPPDEFIPVAEDVGFIFEIGCWVIEQVAKDYVELMNLNESVEISINTSIRELESFEFSKNIEVIFQKYDILSNKVTLEVTETAAMQNPDSIISIMKHLKKFNICFALDDFGTGYSSLGYLKKMPISYVKIDKSFVSDIETDESDSAIVKAIIQLSRAIDAQVIAEGVETEGQYDFLKACGCDYVQGYYFDRPMALGDLLSRYKPHK